MIASANCPLREQTGVHQDVGLSLCHWAKPTAPDANRAPYLRVALPGAQHPIQSYGQLVRDSHFGYAVCCSRTNQHTAGANSRQNVAP